DLKPGYLFHNQGGCRFAEKALLSGCGLAGTGNYIAGMGVEAGDLDGSGHPSLFVTNFQNNPNIFFRNRGGLRFQDWSFPPGLVFSHNAGPMALLHNRTETNHAWLRLELIGDGKKSNRNAIGARVEIESGGQTQVRFVNGGGSYLSASERRLLVGLGNAERA